MTEYYNKMNYTTIFHSFAHPNTSQSLSDTLPYKILTNIDSPATLTGLQFNATLPDILTLRYVDGEDKNRHL